jgi:SHS2 domain-containing protein
MGAFEILEHTADVGLRAFGASPEEVFESATEALATIVGAWQPGAGHERETIAVEPAPDLEAALVDWLSEVLYLQDRRDAVIGGVEVRRASATGTDGVVMWGPRGDEVLQGTAVKAITYHQLRVEQTGAGWVAEVYVDV